MNTAAFSIPVMTLTMPRSFSTPLTVNGIFSISRKTETSKSICWFLIVQPVLIHHLMQITAQVLTFFQLLMRLLKAETASLTITVISFCMPMHSVTEHLTSMWQQHLQTVTLKHGLFTVRVRTTSTAFHPVMALLCLSQQMNITVCSITHTV